MKNRQFHSLGFLFLAGPVLWAEPAPAPDPLAAALPALETSYADFPSLKYKPGDKLQDLVARSGGELELIATDRPAPVPILTAAMADGITYWRLASFTPAQGWAELAAELKDGMLHHPGAGTILDLRSNEAPQDIRGASQMMAFFAPGDTTLDRYPLQNVDGNKLVSANLKLEAPLRGPLVVLTNRRTTGAAEVLAACLKADGALIVGAATAGKGAAFTEIKLSPGQALRFVSDHVRLADGSDPWNHPVAPDIGIASDEHAENAALILIRDNHIADVIGESPDRHRMSEAALQKNQDPEYDDYLASLQDRPVLLSLPAVHDNVLITALDSLKAIRISQLAPVPAPAPAGGASVQ